MIHERDRRTDGQTDRQTLRDSIDRACIASRGKNRFEQVRSWLSTCLRPGFRPGLQLSRVMECGLYCTKATVEWNKWAVATSRKTITKMRLLANVE